MQRILKAILITLSFAIFVNLLSLGRLYFTDDKIARAFLTPYYYAEISSEEYDEDVFIEYMKNRGWIKWERQGGLLVFYKDGQTFTILNNNIKTVFIDGKPVFFK